MCISSMFHLPRMHIHTGFFTDGVDTNARNPILTRFIFLKALWFFFVVLTAWISCAAQFLFSLFRRYRVAIRCLYVTDTIKVFDYLVVQWAHTVSLLSALMEQIKRWWHVKRKERNEKEKRKMGCAFKTALELKWKPFSTAKKNVPCSTLYNKIRKAIIVLRIMASTKWRSAKSGNRLNYWIVWLGY